MVAKSCDIQKNQKHGLEEVSAVHPCPQQHYLQWPKGKSNPYAPTDE